MPPTARRLCFSMISLWAAVFLFWLLFFVLNDHLNGDDETALILAGTATVGFLLLAWLLVWRVSLRRTKYCAVGILGVVGVSGLIGLGVGAWISRSVYDELGIILGFGSGSVVMLAGLVWLMSRWVPVVAAEDRRTVLCPHCGYNLRGLGAARCPECGAEYTLDELFAAQRGDTLES